MLLPVILAFLIAPPAFADSSKQATSSPYDACKMGPDFSSYADAVWNREKQLFGQINKQAQYLKDHDLINSKKEWMFAGQLADAVEFSAIALGVNAVAFGAGGVLAGLESTSGGLLLRQGINGLIGAFGLAWAAGGSNSSYSGRMDGKSILSYNIEGQISNDLSQKKYQRAKAELFADERQFNRYDLSLRYLEAQEHAQLIHDSGIATYMKTMTEPLCETPVAAQEILGDTSCELTDQGLHLMQNAFKYVAQFGSAKSNSKGIQIDSIKNHINTYLEEIKSLEAQMGYIESECKLQLAEMDSPQAFDAAKDVADRAFQQLPEQAPEVQQELEDAAAGGITK